MYYQRNVSMKYLEGDEVLEYDLLVVVNSKLCFETVFLFWKKNCVFCNTEMLPLIDTRLEHVRFVHEKWWKWYQHSLVISVIDFIILPSKIIKILLWCRIGCTPLHQRPGPLRITRTPTRQFRIDVYPHKRDIQHLAFTGRPSMGGALKCWTNIDPHSTII